MARTAARSLVAALLFAGALGAQSVVYVDSSAAPGGNGSSWASAFDGLAAGLGAASSGAQVWVAAGTFAGGGATFQLPVGVAVYGGFAGNETALAQRDFVANPTVLDGQDLATVVQTANAAAASTVLDGFTIRRGFGSNGSSQNGGGFYTYGGSPTLRNLVFLENRASGDGGAIYVYEGSPTIERCTFARNSATRGGALYDYAGDPSLTDCTFVENRASENGGAAYGYEGDATLVNCLFVENDASTSGGALYTYEGAPVLVNCTLVDNTAPSGASLRAASSSASGTLVNCIVSAASNASIVGTFAASYSAIPGSYPGAGNVSGDPLFVDAPNGDFGLAQGSPCVDAGSNAAVPAGVTDDLAGIDRFQDDPLAPDVGLGTAPIVDMGAYERGNGVGLSAVPGSISLANGGTQTLSLNAGPSFANLTYLILGSASGTSPGILLDGIFLVPLNVDGYTLTLLTAPGAVPLASPTGALDAQGRATAQLTLAPGTAPSLAGLTLNHAFVVLDLQPALLALVFVSNAAPLQLLP